VSDAEPDEVEADEVDTDVEAESDDDVSGELPAETAVEVLEYLAKALVADPDGVRVEVDDRDGVTLNVYVSDGDMGRVIGKRGRVANAIRTIGRAAAAKDGETGVAIEFVD
jgi:predicted RNA-binding protein YlqC (UPF0109 family)